ncbi:MAG: hypothetical protein ACKVQR_05850 [Aquabacterium sp.]
MSGISRRCGVVALVASAVLLPGCAAPRWETATYDQFPLNWGRAQRGSALIKVIALTPGGGALSDAIGAELAKRGFVVVPATTTQAWADVDFTAALERQSRTGRQPGGLWKLRHALYARGVDAFLIVRSHDFTPRVYLGRNFWQQADLEVHSTTEENPTSNGAIAGTGFANFHNDRPSTHAEAAVTMVMNLAIGPGGI